MKPYKTGNLPKKDVKTDTLAALLVCDTKTAAAKMLGIDRTTLYDRIKTYGLEDYVNVVQEDAFDILRNGTSRAAKNFVDKIEHRNPQVSMDASREVLDRVGITAKKDTGPNIQVNVLNAVKEDKDKYKL